MKDCVVVTSAFVRISYFDVFVVVSHHNHRKKLSTEDPPTRDLQVTYTCTPTDVHLYGSNKPPFYYVPGAGGCWVKTLQILLYAFLIMELFPINGS